MGVIEFNKASINTAYKTKIQNKIQSLKAQLNTCAAAPSKRGIRKPQILIANDFKNAAQMAQFQKALNTYFADLPRSQSLKRSIAYHNRLVCGL